MHSQADRDAHLFSSVEDSSMSARLDMTRARVKGWVRRPGLQRPLDMHAARAEEGGD